MKRLVIAVTALLGLDVQSRAQSFQPVVLVNAACGSGPGQFNFDPDNAPSGGLAIDSNENIFIIDDFNNRVQHFDEKGNYLGAIAFPPVIPPTAAEKQRNPDIPERPTFVQDVKFVNGVLYALQQRCVNGYVDHGCRVGYLLRAQGNNFVNADQDKDAVHIHLVFTAKYITAQFDRNLRAAYTMLGVKPEDIYKKFLLGDKCGVSRNCVIWQIFIDKKNDAWVLSSEGLQIFNTAGGLLYDNKVGSNDDALSKQGNLYRLHYWGPEEGKSCVQVEKYSLFGK